MTDSTTRPPRTFDTADDLIRDLVKNYKRADLIEMLIAALNLPEAEAAAPDAGLREAIGEALAYTFEETSDGYRCRVCDAESKGNVQHAEDCEAEVVRRWLATHRSSDPSPADKNRPTHEDELDDFGEWAAPAGPVVDLPNPLTYRGTLPETYLPIDDPEDDHEPHPCCRHEGCCPHPAAGPAVDVDLMDEDTLTEAFRTAHFSWAATGDHWYRAAANALIESVARLTSSDPTGED